MEMSERSGIARARVEDLCKVASAKPILFFVGSGVSFPYPSALSSANEILRVVLKAVAPPAASQEELDLISETQPELYYQALVEIAGKKAVEMWSLLMLDQIRPGLRELGPAIGHLALVYLAWKRGLPIITTNYDIRLEQAARKLGLDPIVSHPGTGYRTVGKGSKKVAIWKVRGSVDIPSSIGTTLYNITHLDEVLMNKLQQLFENHCSCFIGYSGRDLDFFPNIVEFQFRDRPFWVDPSFEADHRIHLCPDKFLAVKTDSTKFAHSVFYIAEDDPCGTAFKEAVEADRRLADDEKESKRARAKERLLQLGQQYLNQLFAEILPQSNPDRLLLHALSLASIGENNRALRYIDGYLASNPEPAKACRALVIKAYSLRELSRFRESENTAIEALRIAKSYKLRAERGLALAARDSALYMQQLLPLGLRDERYFRRWRSWKVLLTMFWDRIPIRFSFSSRLSRELNPAHLRARWAYLGHEIRITRVEQKAVLRIVRHLRLDLLAYKFFLRRWRRIESKCRKAGYPTGIGNVRRYLEDFPRQLVKRELPSSRLFELLVARIERALADYGEGERLLLKGDRRGAQKFKEGISKAQQVRAWDVVLRGYIGLRRYGIVLDPTALGEARRALELIQSEALEEIKEDLLQWLNGR